MSITPKSKAFKKQNVLKMYGRVLKGAPVGVSLRLVFAERRDKIAGHVDSFERSCSGYLAIWLFVFG
jgi:hypothetical protein